MAQIIMHTDVPDKAVQVVKEALATETSRIEHSLDLVERKLKKFEKKYNVSSKEFINEWSAEDLRGKDMEYVEWAGEYKLFSRLNDRFHVLKSIKNVTA